jgi:bacillithiol biosynthesis cysteine-adding enzyme BshC
LTKTLQTTTPTKTVSFDKIPGSRKLFLDFLAGNTSEYFHHDFNSDDDLKQLQQRLSGRAFDREKIVSVLTQQNKHYGADERTLQNIQKLKNRDTTGVFTGQQVVMLGGPLLIFYKAALAVKLADTDCRKVPGNVVPIFWLAADDADFHEVANITLQTDDERLISLTYQPSQPIVGKPMATISLDESIVSFLDQYEQLLPNTEFRPELMSVLRECYQPGESIVTAFGKYMTYLFRDTGLVLIDPSAPEFRELAKPIFRKELQIREQGAALVEELNTRLLGKGYHLQVAKPGNYANLFYFNGERTKVYFDEGGFRIDEKFISQEELESRLDNSPELFSPNVFLRAIVQSHIFPTLVYFAGPAETAYFSQIKGLFELFGEEAPIVYPRFSATLIEAKIRRLLDKYELGFEDFTDDHGRLASRLLEVTFPSIFTHKFQELRAEVEQRLGDIRSRLDSENHGLITNAERMSSRIDQEIGKFEEKVFQAHRKKNEIVRNQVEKIGFHLFPHGKLQERLFSLNHYIAKYGFGVVREIYQSVDCESRVHHLINLQ